MGVFSVYRPAQLWSWFFCRRCCRPRSSPINIPSVALWCSRRRTSRTPRCCRCGTRPSRWPWRAARWSSGRSLCRGRSGIGSLCGRATRPPLCRSASPPVGWSNRDAAFWPQAQCYKMENAAIRSVCQIRFRPNPGLDSYPPLYSQCYLLVGEAQLFRLTHHLQRYSALNLDSWKKEEKESSEPNLFLTLK